MTMQKEAFIHKMSLDFLYGIPLKLGRFQVLLPPHLFGASSFLLMISLFTYIVMNLDRLDRACSAAHFIVHSCLLAAQVYTVLYLRQDILSINARLDAWWEYPFLEQQAKQLQKEAKAMILRLTTPYKTGMFFSASLFCLSPLIRFFYLGMPPDRVVYLVFPMATPWSVETWWGYALAYLFEYYSTFASFMFFARNLSYLMAVGIYLVHQVRLLRTALLTIHDRFPNSKSADEEVRRIIFHYLHLYRIYKDMEKIYKYKCSILYHGGMWSVCLSGVILVFVQGENFLMIKTGVMITTEIISLFVFTLAAEYFVSTLEELRTDVDSCQWYRLNLSSQKSINIFLMMLLNLPHLTTFMGTKINIENLNKILNGSYCYFNLILAMKN